MASALVGRTLRAGREVTLRVHGMCMWPTLWPGDRVTISALSCEPSATGPNVGDLVVVERAARLLVHRVVEVREQTTNGAGRMLLCRGDNRAHVDAPIDLRATLGRVSSIEAGSLLFRLRGLAAAARASLGGLPGIPFMAGLVRDRGIRQPLRGLAQAARESIAPVALASSV